MPVGYGEMCVEHRKGQVRGMEYVERKRWIFFGLPFSFTKYMVKEDMITVSEGFFKTVENDCYMYKVQDVTHSASLGEKLFGLFNFSEYDKIAWINEIDGSYVDLISGEEIQPAGVHIPPYGFYYLKRQA